MNGQQQIGVVGVEPAPEQHPVRANLSFHERLKLFATYLVQGFTDDGETIQYDWEAAFAAGIGNNKDSSKALASRYKRSHVVLAEMHAHRIRLEGEQVAHRAEVWDMWRSLYQESTATRKIKVPVMGRDGKVKGFTKTVVYNPALAEKIIEKMARAAQILDDGNRGGAVAASAPIIIAAAAEMSIDDWSRAHGGK